MSRVILVSGWGCPAHTMKSLAVQLVNLGCFKEYQLLSSVELYRHPHEIGREQDWLIGWSLGGQYVLEYGRSPKKILIATAPQWVGERDYQLDFSAFAALQQQVEVSSPTAQQSFSKLVAAGETDRSMWRQAKALVDLAAFSQQDLSAALQVLKEFCFKPDKSSSRYWIYAADDHLVKSPVVDTQAGEICHLFAKGGHGLVATQVEPLSQLIKEIIDASC